MSEAAKKKPLAAVPDCSCGHAPLLDTDPVTDQWVVECRCGRMVSAKGREECVRIWNAALPATWQPRETAPKDRPIQTWDGKCQTVVEWDERLQDFALAPDGIFHADTLHPDRADHRIEWEFTHWHDLREPPK